MLLMYQFKVMKKRILLPTDFSKNAWNALKYAGELYKNEEVDFYILNAFSVRTYDIESIFIAKPGDKEYDEALEHSEKELHKTLKRIEIKNVYTNHNYVTMSIFDTPLNAIKRAVELKDIDLVVMGTKGATDSKTVIYGSNTIDVMEKVRNCPVLAIPSNVSYKEPKEIVFPTSFKTHFKRRELKYLYEIAKITNSVVRILHVNKEENLSDLQQQNKDLLEDFLDGIKYSFHWIENVSVNAGLDEFVRTRGSDMIVFINKKHTFFDSLFTRPLAKDLGASSQIPLLVLHDLRN
jgi:nucleotide-binding universal stress UspA family protein